MKISADDLRQRAKRVITAYGSTDAEATIVVEHLVNANLRGHDSHGVGMIPTYTDSLLTGKLKPNQHAAFLRQEPSIAVFDGQLGYGQVIAREAMDWAIGAAKATGLAMYALRRTHHIGRVGTYGEQAAAARLVSLSFVNVIGHAGRVAAFGGKDGRFGTEPVCIAVPTSDKARPVILDFATSSVALGKMRVAYNEGRKVAPGLMIDAEGQPSDEPAKLYNEPKGSVLPFGGHKGSGLALICGLLGGALGGSGTIQPETPAEGGVYNGMFTLVVNPERLVENDYFLHEVDALVKHVKDSPAAGAKPVQVAGEPERAYMADRLANGIVVDDTTWEQLNKSARDGGLDAF